MSVEEESSMGYMLLLLVIIIAVGAGVAIWYFKFKTKPKSFNVVIENGTGLEVTATLPNGIKHVFKPNEVYPETTFLSDSAFSYTFTIPNTTPPVLKTYTSKVGAYSFGGLQRWYLSRGGLAKRKIVFTATNDITTSSSLCTHKNISFTPVILWDVNIEEILPPIPPRSTSTITLYYPDDKISPVEFRYTIPSSNPINTAWKYDPTVLGPLANGTNLSLVLDNNCNPLYPKTPIDPNEGPKITFKLGTGKGSNIDGVNTLFKHPTKETTDFVICTDETMHTPHTPAGRILLKSVGLTSDKWTIPISRIQNGNLYVGAYDGNNTPPIFGGLQVSYTPTASSKLTEVYKVCKQTSHTLYIWSGKQGVNAGCQNEPTSASTTCKYTISTDGSGGTFNCVAHLSEESGNYDDPCNIPTLQDCNTDAECKTIEKGGKCWTPRYCDSTIKKCMPVKSETETCNRKAMCQDNLACTNGYCGSSPLNGTCATSADCTSDLWCYNGKCTTASPDSGPCDPLEKDKPVCQQGLCCEKRTQMPWIEDSVIIKCGLYNGDPTKPCIPLQDRQNNTDLCYYCLEYPGNPNQDGCPTNPTNTIRIQCTPSIPTKSCNTGFTYIEDSNSPDKGKCVRCPSGYVLNKAKYEINGVFKCNKIATVPYSDLSCQDLCIPGPGESGAICRQITPSNPCEVYNA